MLHALGCPDQAGVADIRVAAGGNHLLAFANETPHALADLRRHGPAEPGDDVVEPADVVAGLLEVMLERLLQLVVGCRRSQLRKCVDQLRLGAVQVGQLLDEEVVERGELHRSPFKSTLG